MEVAIMDSSTRACERLHKVTDLRVGKVSAEAGRRLDDAIRQHRVLRIAQITNESASVQGSTVFGVLAAIDEPPARGAVGARLWTLMEMQNKGGARVDASICVILPPDQEFSARLGDVVGILQPTSVLSANRLGVCLRADSAEQVLVVGRSADYGRCRKCPTAVNRRIGEFCATHQRTEVQRIACSRIDIASSQPKCRLVGLPVRPRRHLSRGRYAVDEYALVIDASGRAVWDEDGARERTAECERTEPTRAERQRISQQQAAALQSHGGGSLKESVGARQLQRIAEDEEKEARERAKAKAGAAAKRARAAHGGAADVCVQAAAEAEEELIIDSLMPCTGQLTAGARPSGPHDRNEGSDVDAGASVPEAKRRVLSWEKMLPFGSAH